MSKGTIGTFLGAGIGFLIGGPAGAQIGALIGGAVGSSFDTIPGRKVGEMASPRAQEGEPIPLVFGSARVTGRLMSCGEPVIRKEKEGGKGGPKVENETAYLSYSILVCESSELRDSSIGGILMVIENNKIVYDVRPNPAINAADSAKWKENKIFYFGGEGQVADPTEQMIHGVGNVPAYRGLCRMVVMDEDVTQHGGSIPTYEFVTSQCGVVEEAPPEEWRWLGTGQTGGGTRAGIRPMSSAMAWMGVADTETTTTNSTAIGGIQPLGSYAVAIIKNGECRIASRAAITTWSAGPTGLSLGSGNLAHTSVFGGRLWVACGTSGLQYINAATDTSFTTVSLSGSPELIAVTGTGTNVLCLSYTGQFYASTNSGGSFTTAASVFGADRFYTDYGALDSNGGRAVVGGHDDNGLTAKFTDDNGATFTNCTMPAQGVPANQVRYCGDGRWLIAYRGTTTSSTGLFKSTDNGVTFSAVTLPDAVTFGLQSKQNIAVDGVSGRVVIAGEEVGTGVAKYYYSDDLDSWTPISTTGTAMRGISEVFPLGSGFSGIELPDAPGHYVDPDTGEVTGPTAVIEDTCPPILLSEIIDKLDARAGIPTANSVTTELDAIEVPGYAVDTFLTVAEAKEPLRQVWFFDCPEWDDAIRYRLRGQATDFTIDPDDLIEGEGATEQGTRGQTVEYPKRLHVQYVDPVTGYKPMKQTAERISPDIRVKGELVAGANITLDADTAKRAADIGLKTAWTEREDSREFAIPVDYWPQAIAAHTFTLEGRRYRITELRLEAGAIYIKSVYDRISAYSSNETGTVGPTPVGGSNLRGPTVSAVMNLPVLRDADDKAGIYWAASGLLPTWQGAQLQLNRGTWENGPQATASATMGTLTAALPSASRYVQDNTNTLSVKLTATSGTLDSVTYADLIAEQNAAAILYADGTAEILQFQTATETAPGEYDLTGLLRGRQDTAIASHASGARFVLLDDAIRFAAIKASDVGKTLTFRPVSVGTSPGSNATQTITMTTIQSLREWSPYNVTVESDGVPIGEGEGAGYCVNWIGRARLGNSRAPAHSQWFAGYRVTFTSDGVTYEVDTTEQSYCADAAELTAAFGAYGQPAVTVRAISRIATNDDDFSSPPSSPSDSPTDITPSGSPASNALGPNGGYPDDTPYPVPEPAVFGTDVVQGGSFAAAGDLSKWRDASGNLLDSRWSIVSGRLCFFGTGTAAAYNWEQRRTLAQQLLPHYSYDVAADIESDAGAMGSIGIGLGFSTGGTSLTASTDLNTYGERPMSVPAEYGEPTAVTHTFADKRDSYGLTAMGQTVVTIVAPAVLAVVTGPAARVYFDNVEMEVTENAPATTAQTIANFDFASGLTGWEQFPPASGVSPSPTVSSGAVTFTPVSEYGVHKYLINTDPITDMDTLDKWVELIGEVKCNDPTVYSGMTRGGVGLQIAISLDGGATYNYTAWSNPVERGDWTERRRWIRQTLNTVGATFHFCLLFKCAVGYTASARNLAANVTNAAVT